MSYKDGGTGKGNTVHGLNREKYEANREKIRKTVDHAANATVKKTTKGIRYTYGS